MPYDVTIIEKDTGAKRTLRGMSEAVENDDHLTVRAPNGTPSHYLKSKHDWEITTVDANARPLAGRAAPRG